MNTTELQIDISQRENLHIVSVNQQTLGTYQRTENGCFICHVRDQDFVTNLESMAITLIQIVWNQK